MPCTSIRQWHYVDITSTHSSCQSLAFCRTTLWLVYTQAATLDSVFSDSRRFTVKRVKTITICSLSISNILIFLTWKKISECISTQYRQKVNTGMISIIKKLWLSNITRRRNLNIQTVRSPRYQIKRSIVNFYPSYATRRQVSVVRSAKVS